MKKALWIISFIPLVGTAVALLFMPDVVPMHYNAAGEIDRWGSKYENLLLPLIVLLLALFVTLLIRFFEKKAAAAEEEKTRAAALQNAKILAIVGVAAAVVFTVLQAFILVGAITGAAKEAQMQTVDLSRISVLAMGVLFIVLGNIMPKTRPNSVVGLRLSWSQYNDNTWRRANLFGGIALIIAGILTLFTGALIQNSLIALLIMMGWLLIAVIASVIYARKVYLEEKAAEKA